MEFDAAFLLALMNSDFAERWFGQPGNRRSKMDIYPDDWKAFPVPRLSRGEQEAFVKLVNAILAEYHRCGCPLPPDAAAKVSELEAEINAGVDALYGVDPGSRRAGPPDYSTLPRVPVPGVLADSSG